MYTISRKKRISFLDSPRMRHSAWGLSHKVLEKLQEAWKERRLVLMLGAGVSQPYGVPTWNDLILEILSRTGSQIRMDRSDPEAVLSWIVHWLGFSSEVLARVARIKILRQLRSEGKPATTNSFAEYLRDVLYSGYQPHRLFGAASMPHLVRLIGRSEQEGRRIPFVITFNFDSILEMHLSKSGILNVPVYGPKRLKSKGIPIYHPHGYLPFEGQIPRMDLVFTEDQYHRVAFTNVHWASVKLYEALTEYTCLMIGLSLSDPNIRRLLDAVPHKPGAAQHFLVRKMPTLDEEQVRSAIKQIKTRTHKTRSSHSEKKRPVSELLVSSRNLNSFGEILRQVMGYEGQSLLDLGVAPLWIRDFEQIPQLLAPIAE